MTAVTADVLARHMRGSIVYMPIELMLEHLVKMASKAVDVYSFGVSHAVMGCSQHSGGMQGQPIRLAHPDEAIDRMGLGTGSSSLGVKHSRSW